MPFKAQTRDRVAHLSTASDDHLFELMKRADDKPQEASQAWEEFYNRYGNYLWNCCLKVCSTVSEGESLAKDVFQSTLQKIYAKAKTYKTDRATGLKSWMSRIAYNEFIDYFNKYNRRFVLVDEMPEVEDQETDDKDERSQSEKLLDLKEEQLKALLSYLSPKEFKVLMTCISYHQIDNPNAHVPDQVIADLCSEFQIKPDALRQIKRRALIKLKNLLSKFS